MKTHSCYTYIGYLKVSKHNPAHWKSISMRVSCLKGKIFINVLNQLNKHWLVKVNFKHVFYIASKTVFHPCLLNQSFWLAEAMVVESVSLVVEP